MTEIASYRVYLEPIDYAWNTNRDMFIMAKNSIERYLKTQRRIWATKPSF